tara:strand:- start:966 stop:1601 length:636 start_codon:yes stop_codon:yes gene_type:complete
MRVIRARAGDAVVLFDGAGTEWSGTISVLARNEVVVAIESERHEARLVPEVTLAQAWLHRDKILDEIVRQSTVLGAAEIVFFRGEHSEKAPRLSDKWERIAVEACKQCGRFWLPRFSVVDDLAAVLDGAVEQDILIAQMEGPHVPLSQVDAKKALTFLVGPEGDFSPSEYAQTAAAGAVPISLGACTYRAEMAALVGLTLIQHQLGHMGPR